MPITRQSNNTTTIIQANWWNDFLDALTGVMNDQPLDLKNSLTLIETPAPSSIPVLAINASNGNKATGTYTYAYTWANSDGQETEFSPTTTVTISSTGSSSIQCSASATPPGVTSAWTCKYYRSKVGTTSPLYVAVTAAVGSSV